MSVKNFLFCCLITFQWDEIIKIHDTLSRNTQTFFSPLLSAALFIILFFDKCSKMTFTGSICTYDDNRLIISMIINHVF